MITLGIASMITGLLNALTSFLPKAVSLPGGADTYIAAGIGYFNSLAQFFPPFVVVSQAFLAFLAYKTLMLILRLLRIVKHS